MASVDDYVLMAVHCKTYEIQVTTLGLAEKLSETSRNNPVVHSIVFDVGVATQYDCIVSRCLDSKKLFFGQKIDEAALIDNINM